MEVWLEIIRIPNLIKAAGDSGERFIDHMVIHIIEVLNLADQAGSKEIWVECLSG